MTAPNPALCLGLLFAGRRSHLRKIRSPPFKVESSLCPGTKLSVRRAPLFFHGTFLRKHKICCSIRTLSAAVLLFPTQPYWSGIAWHRTRPTPPGSLYQHQVPALRRILALLENLPEQNAGNRGKWITHVGKEDSTEIARRLLETASRVPWYT